jgi:hypothetical protein
LVREQLQSQRCARPWRKTLGNADQASIGKALGKFKLSNAAGDLRIRAMLSGVCGKGLL